MELVGLLVGFLVGAGVAWFVLQRLCDQRVEETEARVRGELEHARAQAVDADQAHNETKERLIALHARLHGLEAELERARAEAIAARNRLASQEQLERELAEARATIARLEGERAASPAPMAATAAASLGPSAAAQTAASDAAEELRKLDAKLAMLPAGSSARALLSRQRAELAARVGGLPATVAPHMPAPHRDRPPAVRETHAPAVVEPAPTAPPPAAARPESRDDLKRIKGIGPVLERRLHELGVKSFADLAALTPERVKEIDEAIEFPGRIERERWIEQAKELLARRGA